MPSGIATWRSFEYLKQMALNGSFRLRPSMLGLFVLLALPLMVALVVLTHATTNRAISRTAQMMAERFNAEVIKNIQQAIDPITSLADSTAELTTQEPGFFRRDSSWDFLRACIEHSSDLRGAYVAYSDGSFRAAYRAVGRAVFFGKEAPEHAVWAFRWLKRDANGGITDRIRFIDREGLLIEERPTEVIYDPRKRPWYEAAIAKQRSSLIGPTVFASSGQVGLTFSAPVTIGRETIAVVGMDITLQSFSEFLRANRISDHSMGIVIDREQRVVASSTSDEAVLKVGGKLTVPMVGDLLSPLPKTALAALPSRDHSGVFLFSDPIEHQEHLSLLSRVPLKAHDDWQVLVLAPRSDFLQEISENIKWITSLGAVLLVLQVLMVWWLSRRIAGPLEKLALQVDSIEKLELSAQPGVIRSRFAEIDRLAQSISRMSKALAAFAAYVPVDLVRDLMKAEHGLHTSGRSRFLTMMFTDLEAFSTLSENRPSHELLQQVSQYLGIASRVIAEEKGTVDKFIGDAVMAFWGAPNDLEDHAWRACAAAIRIQQEMDLQNAKWASQGLPELKVRIGVHSDSVLVGNIGSVERMSYTVMGDGVNLASRLEGLNKEFGTQICISKAVYREAGERLEIRHLGEVEVKGRKTAIEVFELLGVKTPSTETIQS